MDPAVQTVTLITPTTTGGATGSHTIDLSQVASLINRRFYRQGINWAVAGFKIFTATPGSVSIHKLQNTWVTGNAWEKAFRKWNKQQMDAVEEMGAESQYNFAMYTRCIHLPISLIHYRYQMYRLVQMKTFAKVPFAVLLVLFGSPQN